MDVETLSSCPSCGGTLAIDPGHDTIRCTHCATRHLPEGMEVTTARGCAACGARIAVNPQIMAAACPFCASPFTVPATQDRHPEPDFVVPFAVTETEARAQIRHWLSKQWLAPAGLRKSALSGDALHGMYLPYWKMIGELRAEQVRVFAKQTVWVDTDADWPPPTRWEHREPMDDLVEGSDTLPSYVRRALSGWDLSTAAPYSPARLSGTLAEIASLSYGTARARVLGLNRGRVEEAAPRPELSKAPSFRSGIRVDHCGLFLMPIWLSAYRWRGQVYHVAVHGQKGTVVGQRPLSRFRFWMMIAALVSACTFYYLMALTDII